MKNPTGEERKVLIIYKDSSIVSIGKANAMYSLAINRITDNQNTKISSRDSKLNGQYKSMKFENGSQVDLLKFPLNIFEGDYTHLFIDADIFQIDDADMLIDDRYIAPLVGYRDMTLEDFNERLLYY